MLSKQFLFAKYMEGVSAVGFTHHTKPLFAFTRAELPNLNYTNQDDQ